MLIVNRTRRLLTSSSCLLCEQFVGSGIFCFKACDPAGDRAAELCEHRYDRVGCAYNAPVDYATINGTFSSCEGEDQLPVGQYISGGRTITWEQPAESLGEITTIPFTASIPATSQCSTYDSSSLYTNLASYFSSASPGSGTTSAPMSGATGATTAGASGNVASGSVMSGSSAAARNAANAAKSSSSAGTGAAGKTVVGSSVLALAALAGAVALLA